MAQSQTNSLRYINRRGLLLLSRIRQPPDLIRAVVGDKHRPVWQYQQSHGPAPNLFTIFIKHPTGEKIIIAAHRLSILETNANDLVAGSPGAIPRSMQGNKDIAFVFLRE